MSDESISFAEAMALDPLDVEWLTPDGETWLPLRGQESQLSVKWATGTSWRRARPRLTRVQEMANGAPGYLRGAEEAIRAVCEYLRREPGAGADDIARHFLAPK